MEIATDSTTAGTILRLRGAFDVRSTSEVRNAIYDHFATRDEDLVVDVSEVEVIDVTALRLLAVATRRAHLGGHVLMLRGCGPTVRRMLHLSRLARAVDVERTAATA